MIKYIVKPRYNGIDKQVFTDPECAINYYQNYVRNVSGKMIGTVDQKLEEMQWIGKLEIVND